MTKLVPESTTTAVAGVWKRLWEEDPLGDPSSADRATLVYWTQAPQSGLYVDLRLPQQAPGRSLLAAQAAGYTHPTPEALQAVGLTPPSQATTPVGTSIDDDQLLAVFAETKSFAGILEYTLGDTTAGEALQKDAELARLAKEAAANTDASGGAALPLCTCFWKRMIDYQPPTGGLDVGVCASAPPNTDGSIDLRETGDDASYAEGWHRLPGSAPTSEAEASSSSNSSFALRLLSEDGVERDGFWVRTNQYFAYAIGRPKSAEDAQKLKCHEQSHALKEELSVGKSLKEALDILSKGDTNDRLRLLGSYVAVFGEIESTKDSSKGKVCWRIQHSTDPGLVGCSLVGDKMGDGTNPCCSTIALKTPGPKQLQSGAILYQSVAGSQNKVRKWKFVELNGKSCLPGLEN